MKDKEIAIRAFRELYPEKYEGRYEFNIAYSARFKGYNANVRYTKRKYDFSLSKNWAGVDDEIKVGIIQHLMNKAFRTNRKTTNIELYDLFLKNIHLAIPKDRINDILKESFERVNERYFNGMITMPNLVLGKESTTKLGSYDYGTDTISMSRILIEDEEVLDYVMYHEMLHKKMKFYTKNNKTYSHTSNFRKKEKEFDNVSEVEKRLEKLLKRKRWMKTKRWSFLDYF